MKPEFRVAQLLLASVFIVVGGHRLWQALHGVAIPNGALVLSAVEFVLGLALATGWRLRLVAGLAAALAVADALLNHRFWAHGGIARGDLVPFMKDVGLVGGLLLLSMLAGGKRR